VAAGRFGDRLRAVVWPNRRVRGAQRERGAGVRRGCVAACGKSAAHTKLPVRPGRGRAAAALLASDGWPRGPEKHWAGGRADCATSERPHTLADRAVSVPAEP